MAIRIPEGASGVSWTDLSDHHRWSVEHLSGLAKSLEQGWKATEIHPEWVDIRPKHRAYVVGSILTSVAFLEATINELFSHAADTDWSMPFMKDSPRCREALAQAWSEKDTERLPTLKKYDRALRLREPPRRSSSIELREEVKLVIAVRNQLVHYRPEWVAMPGEDALLSDEAKHWLQRKLADRFADNPFTGSDDAYWPEKCLGAGCALWAKRVTEGFVDEFKRLLAGSA